ncbi:hypothetical protein P5V15_011390 [Pogonomyrmex californicus]
MAEQQTEETGTGQEKATGRKVVSAKKRACTRGDGPEASPNLKEILRLTLEKLRSPREERARRETKTSSMSGPQEEIPQRPISGQSFSNFNFDCGIKLKLDTYDGNVLLREFRTQFDLIARANDWGNSEKAVVLASCLRGKARSILEGGTEPKILNSIVWLCD